MEGFSPIRPRFRPQVHALMETILVTGGAGFIGSCFVRQCIARQAVRVVNLDKLTYAGNLDSLGAAIHDPRHVFVQSDIVEPGGRRCGLGGVRARGDCPFRGRVARRPLDRRPRDVRADQRSRHVSTAGLRPSLRGPIAGRSAGGVPLLARLDRRGVRFAGADRPLQRNQPLRSQLALFGLESGGRPYRAGLFPHLRPARADHKLLEQLWSLPVPRKVDPAHDPQRPGGKAAARLRRRRERAAIGCLSRTTVRRYGGY